MSVKTKKAWVDLRNLIYGYRSFKKPQEFDIDTCRTIVAVHWANPIDTTAPISSMAALIYLTYFMINVPARYSVWACCVKFVNLLSSGGHDLQSHWVIFLRISWNFMNETVTVTGIVSLLSSWRNFEIFKIDSITWYIYILTISWQSWDDQDLTQDCKSWVKLNSQFKWKSVSILGSAINMMI